MRIFRLVRLAVAVVLFALRAGVAQASAGENVATTPLPRATPWWVERHQEKVAEARRGGVDLLFVGDSITQNYEKPGPAPDQVFLPIWEEFFAPHRAMNLGFSGDETEHVLWRLQHGEVDGLAPRDVVVMIGTNNTAQGQTAEQVSAGVISVVEEIRARMPAARVLLLGILPSGISAEKSAADAAVNTAVFAHYAGSKAVRTLDLGDLFRKNGVLDVSLFYDPGLGPGRLPLHPNTVGQRRMAVAVAQALKQGPASERPATGMR
jgi:lysophospholipase L1-like esterase